MATKTKSIVAEYDLPHPPKKVWRILTEPKLLEAWLMPNDIAAVVGHKFNFRAHPIGNWDGIVWCEMLTVEPHTRLRYSWRGKAPTDEKPDHVLDTVVTWTLNPKPGGTLLRLDHDGFTDADQMGYEQMSGGWKTRMIVGMLRALATL